MPNFFKALKKFGIVFTGDFDNT
ncbi:MAG: hypothetical protein RLZZ454_1703, partial [Pseudomonadota bacterium]